MTVKFKMDPDTPDGTVLLFGVRYVRMLGDGASKVFTYAMLKAGGLWYVTGSGKSPVAAGWGAIEKWLGRDGREVVWVKGVTATVELWPVPYDEPQAVIDRDDTGSDLDTMAQPFEV